MSEVIPLLRAELDLQAAYDRYDEFGLGWKLDTQLAKIFEHLARFPHFGRIYRGTIRRVALRRFPYALCYTVEGSRVLLQAFLDTRQSPGAIDRHLGL